MVTFYETNGCSIVICRTNKETFSSAIAMIVRPEHHGISRLSRLCAIINPKAVSIEIAHRGTLFVEVAPDQWFGTIEEIMAQRICSVDFDGSDRSHGEDHEVLVFWA